MLCYLRWFKLTHWQRLIFACVCVWYTCDPCNLESLEYWLLYVLLSFVFWFIWIHVSLSKCQKYFFCSYCFLLFFIFHESFYHFVYSIFISWPVNFIENNHLLYNELVSSKIIHDLSLSLSLCLDQSTNETKK